jgi:hypothetical protein
VDVDIFAREGEKAGTEGGESIVGWGCVTRRGKYRREVKIEMAVKQL